jgi:transposase-like protein
VVSGVRRRFSPAERERILTEAKRDQLTGKQVAKKFGISQVTYYLWRKNAWPAIDKAARAVRQSGVIDVADEIRRELRTHVQRMVPDVIRTEMNSVMAELFGTRKRGRRR